MTSPVNVSEGWENVWSTLQEVASDKIKKYVHIGYSSNAEIACLVIRELAQSTWTSIGSDGYHEMGH